MSSQGVSGTLDPPLRPSCHTTVGGSKDKPRFAEFACSHIEVIKYPKSLPYWGAKVILRRYTVSLRWSQKQSFQRLSGEATRTSDKL